MTKLTLQRGVERHGPQPDDHVPQKDDDEDPRMGVGKDIPQALEPEPHKHHVGERVDRLGAVEGDVVILREKRRTSWSVKVHAALLLRFFQNRLEILLLCIHLFTPVQSRSLFPPESLAGLPVGDLQRRWQCHLPSSVL